MSWARRITWRCPRPVPPTSQEIVAAYEAQISVDLTDAYSRATGFRFKAINPTTNAKENGPVTEIPKFGAHVTLSRQQALDYGMVEPTPEERREQDASLAEYTRRKRAATAAWPVFVAQVAAITDPMARLVLDLHGLGEYGKCRGCEFDGYDAEPPYWPCTTTTAIAAVAGVTVPPDLHMADRCR